MTPTIARRTFVEIVRANYRAPGQTKVKASNNVTDLIGPYITNRWTAHYQIAACLRRTGPSFEREAHWCSARNFGRTDTAMTRRNKSRAPVRRAARRTGRAAR